MYSYARHVTLPVVVELFNYRILGSIPDSAGTMVLWLSFSSPVLAITLVYNRMARIFEYHKTRDGFLDSCKSSQTFFLALAFYVLSNLIQGSIQDSSQCWALLIGGPCTGEYRLFLHEVETYPALYRPCADSHRPAVLSCGIRPMTRVYYREEVSDRYCV